MTVVKTTQLILKDKDRKGMLKIKKNLKSEDIAWLRSPTCILLYTDSFICLFLSLE